MNNIFNKKFIGFNLIELMIALAIIAIITTIAVTQYNAYLKKVAIATAVSVTDNIKDRVMLYYTDQERFPSIADGSATEINNTFNINAMDANTRNIISKIAFYCKTDTNYVPLPPNVSSTFSSKDNILGYIQVDFNQSQKLCKDPASPAQLFLVAFEVSNQISLNNLNNFYNNNTPQFILASDATQGNSVLWVSANTNVNSEIQGSKPTCDPGFIVIGKGCAQCELGTYTDAVQAICVDCPTGQYSNTLGAMSCTPCATGTYTSLTKSTACASCGVGIATCNASNGGAQSCITGVPLASYALQGPPGQVGTTCRVSCSGSTYANANNGCSACPSTCAACTSNTACSSCKPGFYGDVCQYQCSASCISCTSSTNCTACDTNNGAMLYNNACTQNCPSNYNVSNGVCAPCPSNTWSPGVFYNIPTTCKSCPTNCTACTSDTACSSCKPGFYGDACQYQCSAGCISCTSSTNCTACDTSKSAMLYNNACITSCPAGTYRSSGNCTVCPPGQWSTGGSATSCAACTSSYITACSATTGGATSCINGYQVSGTSGASGSTCIPSCPSNCQTCSPSTVCTQCNSNYYLYNGSCYSSCPARTYSSGNSCLCVNNATLVNGQCQCNDGVSYDANTNSCSIANCLSYAQQQNCLTRKCPEYTVCTACKSGYFINSLNNTYVSQCSPCIADATCNGVDDPVCNNPKYYAGFDPVTSYRCQPCDASCASCACLHSACCTSCNPGYQLINNTYGAPGIGKCILSCSPNCTSCTDSTNCTQCASGYYLYNNACTQSCPGGTYLSNGSCVGCSGGQWSAGGSATSCTACYTGAVTGSCTASSSNYCATNASPSGNTCSCNSGYYWNGASCTACYTGAVTGSCSSTTNYSCGPNSSLSGNTCQCNSGYSLSGTSCNVNCPANASPGGGGSPTSTPGCNCNSSYRWSSKFSLCHNCSGSFNTYCNGYILENRLRYLISGCGNCSSGGSICPVISSSGSPNYYVYRTDCDL